MATTETGAPEVEAEAAAVVDVEKAVEEAPPPLPPEVVAPAGAPSDDLFFAIADVVLRFLLFASALVAVVVLATGKQTKNVSVPIKFENWPALIYFVAALSVAGFYSIITYSLSLFAIIKPGFCPIILSQLIISDVVLLGIVAVATGGASTVGYLGLKGQSHVGWNKVCNVYGVFCRHLGASIGVSIFSCVVLAALVLFSLVLLLKKVPK